MPNADHSSKISMGYRVGYLSLTVTGNVIFSPPPVDTAVSIIIKHIRSAYIQDLLTSHKPKRSFRSATQNLLTVPPSNSKNYRERGFPSSCSKTLELYA